MRRWVLPLAAFGFAQAAGAAELNSENLRGPIVPTYPVVQTPAQAWDLPGSMGYEPAYQGIPTPAQEWNAGLLRPAAPAGWAGPYGGLIAGGAWGSYDPRTSTVAGGYMRAAGAAAVTAAGTQTIQPVGFTTGVEGGYNWRTGNWVFGLEADLQALHLNGATNSGAVPYPGAPAIAFTVTSYGDSNWLFTARPRIGFVLPNNCLFYATGGFALTQLQNDFSFVDSNGVLESGRLDATKAGYAVGGGVEAPLTDRLSLKADYLFVDFANSAGAVTANNLTPFFPGQVFTHSGDLRANIMRAGLNYWFGGSDAPTGGPFLPFKAPVWKAQPPVNTDWQFETGARVWFSSGSVGAPQPLLNAPPTVLASRLTYSGLDAYSGETFARADHVSGFFVKGYLGAGGINRGQLNDEDFPAGTAYSNTLSSASGQIGYATIDLGYNFLRAPGAKVGAFVGYNYYAQAINAYGCTQVAGSDICAPAPASTLLGLTENDSFNSLRVGLSSEVMLTDRLKLTADAAYVPWVNFTGLDDHLLRQLLLPEASNNGNGVMLEAILGYDITNNWNVGIGGRYWAWNMNTGTETFNFLGTPPPFFVEPARFTSERYGMFAQSSYKWGDAAPGAGAVVATAAPMNWTGFYVGGNVGGGWSNGNWSDPFGAAPSGFGGTNIPGFGDTTHAMGPLGGAQAGFDLQKGPAVFGVQADASAASLRGENTCFSGIGGIDCQRVVNWLGTVTGRVGYAWGRSLAYVKGGAASTIATYNLDGNTNALALGTGSTGVTTWGWTVGGGIEYALTDNWSTILEYDYIGVPGTTAKFPTVAVINAQNIAVGGAINVVKLGVNYRFNACCERLIVN